MGTTKDRAEFWALITTCKGKRYEDVSDRWDALLKLLGIPLRLQPLLSHAIDEGRYALADNPQAYIAKVTRNKAKHKDVNLLREEGDLRGAVPGLEAGPISSVSWGVKVRGSALRLKAESHDEFIEIAGYQNGDEAVVDAGVRRNVPDWLRLPEDDIEFLEELGFNDFIDWSMVAKHAVSTPSMIRAVGFVLMRRYGWGQTAKRMIETRDPALSSQQIQSAWRWIDRNFETRIRPLFAMKREPKRQPTKTEPASFVSPGAALLLAGDRARRATGGDVQKSAYARH